VRTGARSWDIRFNFPTSPGQAYVAAAGMLGVDPGIPLGDGRRIWANPGPLLYLTTLNLIPAVFNPGPLVLDAKGHARGVIDLTALPPRGLTIHRVAVVLDPHAPLGLGFITEPVPFRF
jgi:hypothetical protein